MRKQKMVDDRYWFYSRVRNRLHFHCFYSRGQFHFYDVRGHIIGILCVKKCYTAAKVIRRVTKGFEIYLFRKFIT